MLGLFAHGRFYWLRTYRLACVGRSAACPSGGCLPSIFHAAGSERSIFTAGRSLLVFWKYHRRFWFPNSKPKGTSLLRSTVVLSIGFNVGLLEVMVQTESTSQHPPQGWSSSYSYDYGSWSSALSLLSSAHGGSHVNSFYKARLNGVTHDRDGQEKNGLRESSMSPVSVAAPWPVYADAMAYEASSLEPSAQQISYDAETLHFGYGATPIDDSPYMYQLTSTPSRLDPTSSCPRSYPTPDVASMLSREPEPRAFPPWEYTFEPQKQEVCLST